MRNNKIPALVLFLSMLVTVLPPFEHMNVKAENSAGFKYVQDFSGDITDRDDDNGKWRTSYKKGGTVLSNWSRYEDSDGNGMLRLSPNSRPVFWFDSPVTDGNIHLSYDIKYTQSTKAWSYLWGGFQKINGTETETGIEIDGNLDNTGLLNGFGIQTNTHEMLYGMTTSGGGMTTSVCEAQKWYRLDVVHENLGGNLTSEYYIDGKLIHTRTDQNFNGNLYGITFYSTGNNQANEIFIDNLVVEHYYEKEPFKYTQNFSKSTDEWDSEDFGMWETSYKKGGTLLNNWSRYEDSDGNGMLKLLPDSRPVFWFDSPVTDGNIHLSYDVYYTQSSKAWSYLWGGFQKLPGRKTETGIETDGNLDNTGLLNGFGIQTNTHEILYGMTTSGSGMTTSVCEAQKWYKLDVIHENIGGNLTSKYYIDGKLIHTRADQAFNGCLYGVAFYSTSNNRDNEILIDNLVVEHYYEKEQDAKAVFGETTGKTYIDSVTLGTQASPAVATYGNNKCWVMDSQSTDINIVFSAGFKPGRFDGSLYNVEIDYYDIKKTDENGNAVKGYFRLYYDSCDNDKKVGGTVYTNGEQTWKTAVFNLEDADFGTKLDNKYDLRLSLNALTTSGMKASSAEIAVKEIRVKRIPSANPVTITSDTGKTGHTFSWFDEEKIVTNTITNNSNKKQNVSISCKLTDEDGKTVYTYSQEMSLEPGAIKTADADISEVKRCGIYDWMVEVQNQSGVKSEFSPIKIAVIKTDPDGIKNSDIYFAMHGEEYSAENIEKGVEMLNLANVGGVRTSVYWNYLETSKGIYEWEKHKSKPFLDELKENNISILPVLHGGSQFYGLGTTDMPYTADEMEGWKGYISAIAPILSDTYGVERYEIWNEPDIEYFNPRNFDNVSNNGGTGGDYAKLFKETKNIIQNIDSGAKVGGPGMANVEYKSFLNPGDGYKYFTRMIGNGFADYADAVSIHPYGYLGEPVDENDSMISGIKKYKQRLVDAGSKSDYEVWFSETGYTTADSKVGNAYNQGALNCRTAVFSKANGLSDITVFYNMEKKGTVEINREDMFGHVSCAKKGGEKYGTYFVPEKSYLMVAAMNYVMADTEAKSVHDSRDGNVRISRFSSNKFGKDVIAFYTLKDNMSIKLNLGVNEITYYDCLGNETVVTSADGTYFFAAEKAPSYLVGDFTKVEYSGQGESVVIKDVDLSVDGKVTADVFSENTAEESCVIIIKTEKENHINGISVMECTIKNGMNSYTLDTDIEDCDTVSVYVWNGKSDIRPLCHAKKIRITDGR